MPMPEVPVDGAVLNEILFGLGCARVQGYIFYMLGFGIEVDSQR